MALFDDQSGTGTFLIGIIVLVFVGIGLSVLVDRRFSFSKGMMEVEKAVKLGAEEVTHLTSVRDQLHDQLQTNSAGRSRDGKHLASLRAEIHELDTRGERCKRSITALQQELPQLDEEFSKYRESYRQQTWTKAVGEALGTLVIRGGREYRNARITRVTDVGLEIRHDDGIARLQAPDLPPGFRDRFQWDDARRKEAIKNEQKREQVVREVKPGEPKAVPKDTVSEDSETPDAKVLSRARSDVMRLRSRVNGLSFEHASARSQMSSGATSVPGSLETWSARASRLGGQLANARADLAEAVGILASIAPDDPLLQAIRDER